MGEPRKHRPLVVALVALALIAAGCGRSDDDDATSGGGSGSRDTEAAAFTGPDISDACESEEPEATEVGVTADTITIEVMADTGSPLAPGIFQGNVDAVVGFAEYVNSRGGIGCRRLVVRTWDSKFSPPEVKNGQLDACQNAVALVGGNSVFNPDPSAMETCPDETGEATGLPNVAAFAVDTNEMCSPMTIGVNTRAEACPVRPETERQFTRVVGPSAKLLELHPGLHGVYLGNGDLPSTRVSAIPEITALEKIGIRFDAKLLNSATEPQSAYVPRVAHLKSGSNFVYGGTSDVAMVSFMKEAAAQGVDVDEVVWECGVACYTRRFLATGADGVEGAYVWVPFVPLEEADALPALDAYVSTVGDDKVDVWGVVSWQAAIAFAEVVNGIVAEDGPNAITRARILEELRAMGEFDGAGISGPRALGEYSPCYALLQVKGGEFVRTWPEERGTLDCERSNLVTISANPEKQAVTDLRS